MALAKSLLAVLVYAAFLGAAIWTIPIHMDKSGGQKLLEHTCPPNVIAEYSKSYGTGVLGIDSVLCGFDTLFRTSLDGPMKDFMSIFILNGPMVLFVLMLESTRGDKPYASFVPLLFGALTQTITAAIAGSFFWLLFLAQASFGGKRQAREPVSITAVESSLLAVLVGYLIPSAWMLTTKSSLAIVLWHPFPLYMSIVQTAWTWYRGKTPAGSGFAMVQWTLLLFSFIGSITWIYTLMPYASWNALVDIWNWLPTFSIPEPATTTVASAVLHLLQYDAIWMFGATLVAGLFLLDDTKDVLFAAQTMPAMIALCGPAAVIGGLWIFRELYLMGATQRPSVKSKAD